MGEGAVDDAKGRLKEAGGSLTGDDPLKREGKVGKASGKLKDAVGDVSDKAKDAVNPDRNQAGVRRRRTSKAAG